MKFLSGVFSGKDSQVVVENRLEARAITLSGGTGVISNISDIEINGSPLLTFPDKTSVGSNIFVGAGHYYLNTTSPSHFASVESSSVVTPTLPVVSNVGGGEGFRTVLGYDVLLDGESTSGSYIEVSEDFPSQMASTASFLVNSTSVVDSTGTGDSTRVISRSFTLPSSSVGDTIVLVVMTREVKISVGGFSEEGSTSFIGTVVPEELQFLTIYKRTATVGDSGRVINLSY